jgi:hypothetical protein
VVKLGFERCYVLDDGDPPRRPAYLSPIAIAQTLATAIVLVMLLFATPFWHSTPAKPVSGAGVGAEPLRPVSGVAVQPVGAVSR